MSIQRHIDMNEFGFAMFEAARQRDVMMIDKIVRGNPERLFLRHPETGQTMLHLVPYLYVRYRVPLVQTVPGTDKVVDLGGIIDNAGKSIYNALFESGIFF